MNNFKKVIESYQLALWICKFSPKTAEIQRNI